MQKDCLLRRKLLWAGTEAPKFMFLLGKNTPGIWGLGRELHMYDVSVGSLLPAHTVSTGRQTHTHTDHRQH